MDETFRNGAAARRFVLWLSNTVRGLANTQGTITSAARGRQALAAYRNGVARAAQHAAGSADEAADLARAAGALRSLPQAVRTAILNKQLAVNALHDARAAGEAVSTIRGLKIAVAREERALNQVMRSFMWD